MNAIALDRLPGFRRRFRVTPARDRVTSEVEDDYHCMSVTLRHDGVTITAVEPLMQRVPWTTCPGAVAQLVATFTGVRLDSCATRGEKTANCTHLHDLALLAAAHAHDVAPLVYDILVSDPVDGRSRCELRRDGARVLAWTCSAFTIVEPATLAGTRFDSLRSWIDSLDAQGAEAARLLRWGSILAHGRTRATDRDPGRLPVGNCYTFQRERLPQVQRIVDVHDFSAGGREPLSELPRRPQ
jgi:hypothetical protein